MGTQTLEISLVRKKKKHTVHKSWNLLIWYAIECFKYSLTDYIFYDWLLCSRYPHSNTISSRAKNSSVYYKIWVLKAYSASIFLMYHYHILSSIRNVISKNYSIYIHKISKNTTSLLSAYLLYLVPRIWGRKMRNLQFTTLIEEITNFK